MIKPIIALIAGAFAFASLPTLAAELPDYGSKNFSPAGDTPAYFANESMPVSARTADTTERDWSAVDEIAPSQPVGHGAAAYHSRGQHGRYVFGRGPSLHAGGRASHNLANWNAGARAASHPAVLLKARSISVGKHGKATARHASAAAAHPAG